MSCTVTIRGIVENPSVTEINIRSGPNTGYALLFKARVGTSGIPVLETRTDDQGQAFKDNNKIYRWFKLQFADGQVGWARDDLIELEPGDWTAFGYGNIFFKTLGFALTYNPPSMPAPIQADASTPIRTDAPVVTPPVEPPPAPPAPAAPAAVVGAIGAASADPGASAVVTTRGSGRVRSGPGTTFGEVTFLDRGTTVSVLDVKQEVGGPFLWARVKWATGEGWMQETLLHFQGSGCEAFGLKMDRYAPPMKVGSYWWIRGFEGPQPQHPGWDLGGNAGEPIYCGPNGGTVLVAFRASKPTPEKPSVVNHGIKIGTSSIFSDPGWGYGYGNYVIVRYTNDQLPASTREMLKGRGFGGAAIFVMFAHMTTLMVEKGQTLAGGTQIGTCGTTGNSEAPHVHLEIRAWTNPNEQQWSTMLRGLIDPGILFQR